MEEYLKIFESHNLKKQGSKLIVDGIAYTEAQLTKDIPTIIDIETDEATKLISLSVTDKAKYKKICKYIFSSVSIPPVRENPYIDQEWTLPNLEALELVSDIKTGQGYVVDMSEQKLTLIHPNAFWSAFTGKDRKEVEATTSKQIAHCVFDPTDERAFFMKDNIAYLNRYSKPSWTEADLVAGDPEIFVEFLRHLFNNDIPQIRFVIGWLYRLMNNRNETALVLNGMKGVGKNMLYSIAKALVGQQYCSEATKKFGVKEFNDILREKILILIDEHQVNKDKYNFLKASFNEYQTIEAKGQAVKSTEKIYTNFMIFHNSPEDLYLENAERRFSVMDITETPLDKSWPREKIEGFFKEMNDPASNLVANIGQYVNRWAEKQLAKGNSLDPFDVYLGEKYQEILDCHVSTIIQSMIDLIEKDKVIDGCISGTVINTNCQKLLGIKMFCKGPRARTLVREYRYMNKYELGEVVTDTMPWKLKVNPDVMALIQEGRE